MKKNISKIIENGEFIIFGTVNGKLVISSNTDYGGELDEAIFKSLFTKKVMLKYHIHFEFLESLLRGHPSYYLKDRVEIFAAFDHHRVKSYYLANSLQDKHEFIESVDKLMDEFYARRDNSSYQQVEEK